MGTDADPKGGTDVGTDADDGSKGEGNDAGGAPKQGDESKGGRSAAAPVETASEFRGQLHPILRDMAPEQITELFETLSAGVYKGGRKEETEPEPPPPPTPPTKDEMKDMFDPTSEKFDPAAATKAIMTENYGGLVADLQSNALVGVFGAFRTRLPDFEQYEARITEELKGAPNVTQQGILNTYFALKGMDMTAKERADKAKAAGVTTTEPSPPEDPKDKEIDLSEQEKMVAGRMFPKAKDQAEAEGEYKKFAKFVDTGIEMEVPTE